MKWLAFSFLLIGLSGIRAQSTNELKIEFSSSQPDNQFELDVLRFYISNVKLLSNGSIVFSENDSYHLIDIIEKGNSFILTLPDNLKFDHIQIDLGIDSITNVSGVYSGDLDPTKGMYWTWQSGYINFKLEGKHPTSNAKNNVVQLHLGGYLQGQLAVQSLDFKCANSSQLNIQFDLNSFLKSIDFSNVHTIMSPGERAVTISGQIATYFILHE